MPTFEFIVEGHPYSVNSGNKKEQAAWQMRVNQAAKAQWLAVGGPDPTPIRVDIEVYITMFTPERRDVDNIIKPIFDSLKPAPTDKSSKVAELLAKQKKGVFWFDLCEDDKQLFKVTSERVDIRVQAVIEFPSELVVQALVVEEKRELVHVLLTWEADEE